MSDNGNWLNFAWVGGYCDSGDCAATIDLGGLYSSVGGFMNYAPDTAAYGGPPTITAIAADGTTILESYNLATDAPISTPQGVNDGAYRGISRGVADIAFIRISGSYLIMHDLTLVGGEVAPVPEPATFGLAGLVLASIVVLRRRLKG